MTQKGVYLNGVHFANFGLTLESTALSALLTPPPLKTLPATARRLATGKDYALTVDNVVYDERSVTLPLNLVAPTSDDFLARYRLLCHYLSKGAITLFECYTLTTYHFLYQSCAQFSEYSMGLAMISLKLVEPDPGNRITGERDFPQQYNPFTQEAYIDPDNHTILNLQPDVIDPGVWGNAW